MTTNAEAAVWGALAADSLALGAHWIYNTNVIDRKVGEVRELLKPIVNSWHPTKAQGEFTHYGDQTLLLLKSVAAGGGFTVEAFGKAWEGLFRDYDGYVDKATQATQANLAAGKPYEEAGSDSSDLGGAARIAPLILRYREEPEQLMAAARAQTQMTHTHEDVVQSALFFARVTLAVLKGEAPRAAMESACQTQFNRPPLKDWVAAGLESAGADTRETISAFGQQCEVEAAFPATIHLLASYSEDFEGALVANVMAGGDSASRGLMAGMVLGAHLGMEAIPQNWIVPLKARKEIEDALQQISKAIPA